MNSRKTGPMDILKIFNAEMAMQIALQRLLSAVGIWMAIVPVSGMRCAAKAIKREDTKQVRQESDLVIVIHHLSFQYVHLVLLT